MKNICIIIVVIVFFVPKLHAQHFMGALLDDAAYEDIPQKPKLLMRSYTNIPSAHSLMKYCPTALNQGDYGTCTSWSSTYCARTILEAINNNWTDKSQIDNEAFAPIFVYALIKDTKDYNCSEGTYIGKALATLKEIGAPKKKSFNVMCADDIPQALYTEANQNKIDGYTRLFNTYSSSSEKIGNVKKAIAENRPVIICMECYESFNDPKDLWSGEHDKLRGYHAMCVIGYDDNKYGGAFQIMNSWGDKWGTDGYVWVKYEDFSSSVRYAYEMYMNKKPKPKPQPVPQPTPKPLHLANVVWMNDETFVSNKNYNVMVGISSQTKITSVQVTVNGKVLQEESSANDRMRGIFAVSNDGYDMKINRTVMLNEGENTISIDVENADGMSHLKRTITYKKQVVTNEFSGNMYLQLATGEKLKAALCDTCCIPAYDVEEPLISGTRYRIYITNDKPAYVYVIGSDMTNNASILFPTSNNVSARLDYSVNEIALPDEKYYIELDNNVGKDFLCILYSAEELPINDIVSQLKSGNNGTFIMRLKDVLGEKLASLNGIAYSETQIGFKAQTTATVVPIIGIIKHIQ